jgi:hypothetical protein
MSKIVHDALNGTLMVVKHWLKGTFGVPFSI